MAIPPISNNPLLKLFRTDRQGAGKDEPQQETKADTPQAQQDIVEISAAAQQRLDGIRDLTPQEAQETAIETRDILAHGENALGLPAEFS